MQVQKILKIIPNFMSPPELIKYYPAKLTGLIFLVLFFLLGCHQKENEQPNTRFPIEELSQDEKQWLSKFTEDFFLHSPAIYTLFGTKPMSGITIDFSKESDLLEEWRPRLQNYSDKERNKWLKEIKIYYQNNDLFENWTKWVKWKRQYPSTAFLFRIQPSSAKFLLNADVINVQEVISTLHIHYETFSRELEMNFDPIEVALEFENSESTFWKAVFNNHLLQGILYGFGERNSYFFYRQMKTENTKDINMIYASQLMHESRSDKFIEVPKFKSYYTSELQDPVMEKYRNEREVILKRLKGKVFLEEALNKLFPGDNTED